MSKIYILIIGMAIVTYLPRYLPFMLMSNKKLPPKVEEFLGYIPYAALGALIIPGFLTAIEGHPIVSVIGILVTLAIALFKDGVVLPVLGSIATCMLLLGIGM